MQKISKYLKTILKYLSRFLLGIIGVLLTYFLIAFLLSVIPTRPTEISCAEKETIYLISNGIHLDIVLKTSQLDTSFRKELGVNNNKKYVAFGWGDKGFYLNTPTWNELKTSTVINALFLKSESAMHVSTYHYKPKKFVPLPICAVQLDALKEHIKTSFVKNKVGKIIKTGKGYGANDDFYEAKGSYNAIKTCNEWVNIGLKKADIKTAIWSPFDMGILYHVN